MNSHPLFTLDFGFDAMEGCFAAAQRSAVAPGEEPDPEWQPL